MQAFEKIVKVGLLYAFCFLNVVDLLQTLYFIEIGIERNPFAVFYPHLWIALKIVFTFGIPVGLYLFDLFLEEKGDGGIFHTSMKSFVPLIYFIIFFADIYFLLLVLKNMRILGRFIL